MNQTALITIEMNILSEKLGYTFRQPNLLQEALTHSSASREQKQQKKLAVPWNERLEFLGDAVLSLALSTALMKREERFSEGQLSKIRAALVNEKSLASISRRLGVGEALVLGKGEERNKGRDKDSVLADALEALLGAVYLDSCYEAVEAIILNLFQEALQGSLKRFCQLDYKTRLQELTQSVAQKTPTYRVRSQCGPDHEASFEVEVTFNRLVLGVGHGESKKSASQQAAEQALDFLKQHPGVLKHNEVQHD